jgi:uncharacterized membrane protein (GlpM family)
MYPIVKIFLSATLIVSIAEISKRNSFLASLLASLPLVSLLSFVWIYIDTKDTEHIATLANSILWLVIPSLVLFLTLPPLLRAGYGFYLSLGIACGLTATAYFLTLRVLHMLRISV